MEFFKELQQRAEEALGIESTRPVMTAEEAEADTIKNLSQDLDVDALDANFKKFAGLDDCLSKDVRARSPLARPRHALTPPPPPRLAGI